MALSGQQFTIHAGDHEATITEVGASLRRYACAGTDVTAAYREDELTPNCCGVVLVPWPNRLRGGRYTFAGTPYQLPITEPGKGNAMHGLARWARWSPVSSDDASVTLGIDLVPQTGWPFEVRVEVTYALDAARGLRVTAVASNTGANAAPFGAGFHPYLSVHGHQLGEVTVQVPARQRLVTDEAQIPVSTRSVEGTPYDLRLARPLGTDRFDDGFAELSYADGHGAAVVATPSGGARVWFEETFRYLQVFTSEKLVRGTPAVAIEPMTCPANAFNSGDGLIVLEPGDTWAGAWGIAPLVP